MHVLLFLAGLVALVAGTAMLALAIPGFRSDLANPLLVSATVAISVGFMLIGLAAIVLRLWRLTELLETRPVPRSLNSGPTELQSSAIAAISPSLESPTQNPGKAGEQPRSERQSQPAAPLAAIEHPRPAVTSSLVPEPPTDIPGPLIGRATGAAAATEWPHVTSTDRLVSTEASTEPAEIQLAWAEELEPRDAPHGDADRELATTPPPTLLKSGVIEGMPYTLYSDGSVEAELPQGTMRFASIAEWRVYMRAPP